jgi:hypothetical protein
MKEVLPTRESVGVQIERPRTMGDVIDNPANWVNAKIVRKDGSVEDLGWSKNLRTNAGRDWQSDVMGNPTQPAAARFIGLTTNATAPAAGDTTLTSEIAAGGLGRAAGTYAHTAGTNTYTIEATFTASATHTNVAKAGLFSASSGGTLAFATLLPSTATLNSGDTLTVTWTVTLS